MRMPPVLPNFLLLLIFHPGSAPSFRLRGLSFQSRAPPTLRLLEGGGVSRSLEEGREG